ncbi:MAG: hypothetical protein GY953_44845, partial [bacterium]|nr:hypothetical protein [bacterium]
ALQGSRVMVDAVAGAAPTNVAFGLPGDKKINVTEYARGTVEVFDVETDGLPLYA